MGDVQYNDNIHYGGAISAYEPRINLIEFFETLTDMERAVLKLRSDNPTMSNVDAARLLAVSEGRVRAIRKQIQAKYGKLLP